MAVKKAKTYLGTFELKLGYNAPTKHQFCHSTDATQFELAKEFHAVANDFAIKKYGKVRVDIIITWFQALSVLLMFMFTTPVAASRPCQSPLYRICIEDFNIPTTKVGNLILRDADACSVSVRYAHNRMKKTYDMGEEIVTYYVDIYGRETITVNSKLVYGPFWLTKESP